MLGESTFGYVTAAVALSAVLSTGCQNSGGHLAHSGCKDGLKKLQQSPDKYLAKVHAETGAGS